MRWQAVFFDFDGVILDSVDVKTNAFAKMFRPYGPEVETKVVAYHLENKGISRYDKFQYYYRDILKKEIAKEDLQKLGEQFSKLVLQGVLNAPFVAGALETLQELHDRGIPAYIISGTPHEEINYIVEEKGLSLYFREVHGTPRQKSEILRDILVRMGYQHRRCLFVGDAVSDFTAARENHVNFLGIVKKNESSPFHDGTNISPFVTMHIHSRH